MVNEEVIITRDVPPPNWADLPLYAIATSLQAVARDGAGHLYVYFRTWLLRHNRDSPVEPRDGRIRAQLMVNLHSNIRRLWREHIDPDDDIKTTVVRPNPVLGRNEGPMLLLLVECNRPIGSPTRPMLLTFQEIDVRGPEPERSWRAVLAPPTINLQYLADRCACEPQHIIAPLGTEDRRWIGQDQSRPAVPNGSAHFSRHQDSGGKCYGEWITHPQSCMVKRLYVKGGHASLDVLSRHLQVNDHSM